MKKKIYILIIIAIAIIMLAVFLVRKVEAPISKNQQTTENIQNKDDLESDSVANSNPGVTSQQQSETVDPLENASARITKKPFGIFVTPKNSPVQPEKFSGYHNAVDLEITDGEENIDVPVKAFCDGELLSARTASGYGGVVVQGCNLEGQAVTIVYGHLRLSSLNAKIGDQLKAGDFLANLGNGFSEQTDGERKHLHLGIHKGVDINILGYVGLQSQLSSWIDPVKYFN